MFNDKVSQLQIINLTHRTDRKAESISEFKKKNAVLILMMSHSLKLTINRLGYRECGAYSKLSKPCRSFFGNLIAYYLSHSSSPYLLVLEDDFTESPKNMIQQKNSQ